MFKCCSFLNLLNLQHLNILSTSEYLCVSRVQILTLSTNLETPSPAASISPWRQTTPCHQRPTRRDCSLLISPVLTSCPPTPTKPPGSSAAASASPRSPNTWRPPQRCRRSRDTSLTRFCQEPRESCCKCKAIFCPDGSPSYQIFKKIILLSWSEAAGNEECLKNPQTASQTQVSIMEGEREKTRLRNICIHFV